jgi:type IV secretory pathway protease TraF
MYKVTYSFICKECGKENIQSFLSDLAFNPTPSLPVGWYQFPDGYVCDGHRIIIEESEESPL